MSIRQQANFSAGTDDSPAGHLKLPLEDSVDLANPGDSFYDIRNKGPKLHKEMAAPSSKIRNMPTQSI